MQDTNISSPADGEVLTWSSAVMQWVNSAVGSATKWIFSSSPYWSNDSTTVYFNETQLNATIDSRAGTGGNTSWNETLADTLYVNINGDVMTGDLNMDSYRLTNVGEIVMSGAIQGQNILPSQNMTYSLGNETNWFLEAYIGTINAINITANNLNSTIINSENITSENVDSTNIDSEEVNISNNLTIGGTKITVVGDTTYYKSVA